MPDYLFRSTWWLLLVGLLYVVSACLAADDSVTILNGATDVWTASGEVFVLVTEDGPEPLEHLFVLNRRESSFNIERSYAHARVAFRSGELEVSGGDEKWVLRLVSPEGLSTEPRRPDQESAGLLVGFGLSHHEQPVEAEATAFETQALGGAFRLEGGPGASAVRCRSGGFGASSCSIACGASRSCSADTTLGFACCNCRSEQAPVCKSISS